MPRRAGGKFHHCEFSLVGARNGKSRKPWSRLAASDVFIHENNICVGIASIRLRTGPTRRRWCLHTLNTVQWAHAASLTLAGDGCTGARWLRGLRRRGADGNRCWLFHPPILFAIARLAFWPGRALLPRCCWRLDPYRTVERESKLAEYTGKVFDRNFCRP